MKTKNHLLRLLAGLSFTLGSCITENEIPAHPPNNLSMEVVGDASDTRRIFTKREDVEDAINSYQLATIQTLEKQLSIANANSSSGTNQKRGSFSVNKTIGTNIFQ